MMQARCWAAHSLDIAHAGSLSNQAHPQRTGDRGVTRHAASAGLAGTQLCQRLRMEPTPVDPVSRFSCAAEYGYQRAHRPWVGVVYIEST